MWHTPIETSREPLEQQRSHCIAKKAAAADMSTTAGHRERAEQSLHRRLDAASERRSSYATLLNNPSDSTKIIPEPVFGPVFGPTQWGLGPKMWLPSTPPSAVPVGASVWRQIPTVCAPKTGTKTGPEGF